MSQESYQDQLERVTMMSEAGDTWDLSDNDRLALKAVLSRLEKLEAEAAKFLRQSPARLHRG